MKSRTWKLLIGKNWVGEQNRSALDVICPANEQIINRVVKATENDIDEALVAAQRAFKGWRNVSPWERGDTLKRCAQEIRKRAPLIANLLTLEQGKPTYEASAEVAAAADHMEWSGEEAKRLYGRIVGGRIEGERHLIEAEPVGPVAAFTPWNFPAVLPVRKIGAAIAAGCSCILKPAEETPGAAVQIAEACLEAGLPPGVLNILFGDPTEISERLVGSDVIKKISLTGSVPVGKVLASLAAKGLKRATFELSGHSPVIVCDDADLERAVAGIAGAKFRNAGQVCVSPSRFFVQRRVYEEFVFRFSDIARKIVVGDGLSPQTRMGPLANIRRMGAMKEFVDDAIKKGGDVVTGGHRIGENGYFWAPTVIAGVSDDARIMNEEVFGPVAPITPFESLDEVVVRANSSTAGLGAYIFSRSHKTSAVLSQQLDVGMVAVNAYRFGLPETPVCGVKDSGYGHEGGMEGVREYLRTKLITEVYA